MSEPKFTNSRKGLRQGFWTWCIFGAGCGGQRGIRYRQERYHARVCLALTQAAGVPVLALAGLAQHEAKSLRRMR
jgi:hypothetical protein